MPQVVDIEQAVLLLEVEPPFDKRDIQLARRRLAKQWHPDIAPPGKQLEHERHLKAVNEAADQLERLAEDSRGGKVSRNAVKVAGQAARKRRAEEGARAYEEEQRQRAAADEQRKHDPFASRVPDHSVVHRYARCLSYPEWGVGSVNGIYFTGEDDDIQQWARVSFQVGVRTVPAGSLQFVDFHKPDPGAERVQRFMTAAKHALAEGDFKLAARRLVFARDADPRNLAVLRLLPTAYWQAGDYPPPPAPCATGSARSRAARRRTGPPRGSTRTWARSRQAIDETAKEAAAAPAEASAWERLGRLRLRAFDRDGAREALERARDARRLRAGPARPRARRAPLRRPRRRDHRLRAGDGRRPGVAERVGPLRARAGAHGPADRLPAPRASGRSSSATTRRSASCATACSPPLPAS